MSVFFWLIDTPEERRDAVKKLNGLMEKLSALEADLREHKGARDLFNQQGKLHGEAHAMRDGIAREGTYWKSELNKLEQKIDRFIFVVSGTGTPKAPQ